MNVRLPALSTGTLLLLSYVALIVGVRYKSGFYAPFALAAIVGSFLCLLRAAVTASKQGSSERYFPEWSPFLALLLFLLLGARRLPGIYLTSPLYAVLYFYCTLLLIPLLTFVYLFPREWKNRVRKLFFGIAVLITFAFRLAMPGASPKPTIDVFVVIQESAEHLLEGRNPYDTPISNALKRQPHRFLGYPYPPASLYPLVIGYALFGDARYIYILCEAIAAAVLWYFARSRWTREV